MKKRLQNFLIDDLQELEKNIKILTLTTKQAINITIIRAKTV